MRFREKQDTEDVGIKPQDLARSSAPVNPQPRCSFRSLFRTSSSRGASDQFSRGPQRRTSPTKRKEPFSAVAIGSAIGGTFGGAIGALIDARRANIDVTEIRAAAIRSQQPRRPFTYSHQTVSMTELTPGG